MAASDGKSGVVCPRPDAADTDRIRRPARACSWRPSRRPCQGRATGRAEATPQPGAVPAHRRYRGPPRARGVACVDRRSIPPRARRSSTARISGASALRWPRARSDSGRCQQEGRWSVPRRLNMALAAPFLPQSGIPAGAAMIGSERNRAEKPRSHSRYGRNSRFRSAPCCCGSQVVVVLGIERGTRQESFAHPPARRSRETRRSPPRSRADGASATSARSRR